MIFWVGLSPVCWPAWIRAMGSGCNPHRCRCTEVQYQWCCHKLGRWEVQPDLFPLHDHWGISLRHHAARARAAGFCYVADCVLAVLALKTVPRSPQSLKLQNWADQRLPRIFYLDLDLHFSDVVSSAFTSFTAPGAPRLMVYITIVELTQRVFTHDLCLFFSSPVHPDTQHPPHVPRFLPCLSSCRSPRSVYSPFWPFQSQYPASWRRI